MILIQIYGKEIISIVIPLITWLLNTFFRAETNLLLASPHTFTFLVQQPLADAQGNQVSPTQTVHTRSLMVRNAGKETATNVEWVFNSKPMCINIWPSRHFEEHIALDNWYNMIFSSLAPEEHLGCEIFSINSELPNLVTVRSDQCVAQTINMYPLPIVPLWKQRITLLLLLSGLALAVCVVILLLQFLINKTPFGH